MVEVPKDVLVWVRLPNLPIHCWNPTSVKAIKNGLGQYIDRADPKDQYSCARIYVEVELEEGLIEAIKLKVGEWHHYQKLDYEQLSFKCRGCHEYGHFQCNCPKNPNKEKENGEGWQQPKKGKTATRKKGPRNEKTGPTQPIENETQSVAMVENNPRNPDKGHAIEKAGKNPWEDFPAEDMQGNSPQGTREAPVPEPEEE
jgi:hypothetical protein